MKMTFDGHDVEERCGWGGAHPDSTDTSGADCSPATWASVEAGEASLAVVTLSLRRERQTRVEMRHDQTDL